MKKTKPKKLLTVLLTLYLALSIVPITAYAGVTDVIGDNTTKPYSHFYHTKVETTAQVTIKDADGNVAETTEVTKSGDFVEGNVNSDAVQAEIKRIDDEIIAQFSSRGNITTENRNSTFMFDHFESGNIIAPDGNILVGDQDALENAASGSVNKNIVVHEYQVYQTTYDLIVQAIDGGSQDEATINNVCIENVKFAYRSGDAPQATAEVYNADADKYEIAYECWQEFENNEPVAAWYSDNGSHGSLPTITEFESGKRYVYSLMLKPKDGYSFNSETTVTVNGESVTSSLLGDFLYLPAVKTITMPTLTVIDVVEINGATVSFQDGDRPVFTGDVPDDVYYVLRAAWWELNSTTGLISTEPEFGSGIYENKIVTFEAGKTYHYGVYVVAYGDVGNVRYVFGPDTELKINGEFVNYKRYEGDASDGSDGTMWVLTDLTMTPEAGGTAPSEKYTVTYTDGVDGEEIFKDQTYTVEAGKATPAFNGTPARDGYTFVGWKPAVAATVTGNATYEATWKSDSATTTPSDNKPSTGETTSPKTGDTSNIVLWAALLFVSCGTLAGTLVIDKKKKTMK